MQLTREGQEGIMGTHWRTQGGRASTPTGGYKGGRELMIPTSQAELPADVHQCSLVQTTLRGTQLLNKDIWFLLVAEGKLTLSSSQSTAMGAGVCHAYMKCLSLSASGRGTQLVDLDEERLESERSSKSLSAFLPMLLWSCCHL